MMDKPTIGIIMGDPAGIGPEITLKALAEPEVHDLCRPVVIGDHGLIDLLSRTMCLNLRLNAEPMKEGDIRVIDTEPREASDPIAMGSVSAAAGHVVLRAIRRAFDLARTSDLQAIVMAPITKESLAMTGMGYHSEFDVFSASTGVRDLRAAVKWKEILRMTVTGHIPFRDIADALTTDSIVTTGRQLATVMSALGHGRPRLAVAALNPHGGEGGIFGDEEATMIGPAIDALRSEGLDVHGPIPADTVFSRTIKGDFQGVVFLYHDQGNIAMKSVAFGEGVLIYAGLPFPVTSPGHGSALDIAGKGIADPGNLVESIRVAAQLARTTMES
jgi:4-phospho-D-threonate 3-dehydrogenase / 4-phospho-D-erythronate 3-dehydrogenase